MSGVDGAVKLNSLHAPSVKNTETEKKKKSVSAFVVPKNEEKTEEKVVEVKEEPIEIKAEEVKEELVEIKIDQPIEIKVLENIAPVEIQDKPKKQKKNSVNIRAEFEKLKDFVFKMYETAFDKTPSFSPTKEQTVGDLLLYLSKKLSFKNADSEFNDKFGLEGVSIPNKYDKNYIPLCLKLAKWCEDNKVMTITEDLLYLISSLYLNSAKACGVIITELEIAVDFDAEINYAL